MTVLKQDMFSCCKIQKMKKKCSYCRCFSSEKPNEDSSTRLQIDMDDTNKNGNTKSIQTEENMDFQCTNMTKLAEDFSANTTLHGYRYLFAEKGYRRLIWIVVMVIAICFAIYSVKDQFQSYGRRTKTTFEVYDVDTFDFPTVSFCLSQPAYYNKRNLSELNLSKREVARLYEEISDLSMHLKKIKSPTVISKLKAANITTYRDFLSLFDITVEDMARDYVIDCHYDGVRCKISQFKATLSPKGCLCMTFNHYEKNKTSLKSNCLLAEGGLNLLINLNAHRRLADDVLNDQMLFFAAYPYGHFIDNSMITNFRLLKPGTVNIVHLDETQVELLPKPYQSECGEKELKLVTGYQYSKALCQIDRQLQQNVKKCGCVLPTYEELVGENVPLCRLDELNCLTTVDFTLRNDSHDNNLCPRECHHKRYKTGTLAFDINVREHEVDKMKNFVMLNVKFRDSILRIEKQEPAVSLGDLLGGIGGGFGLFLGFSCLTFVEFLYFAWDLFIIWWCRRKSISKIGETNEKHPTPLYYQ